MSGRSGGALLELVREIGGPRYYLDGRPLHAGDCLEIWIDGRWRLGRYEYRNMGDWLDAMLYIEPELVYALRPDWDRFRWTRRDP